MRKNDREVTDINKICEIIDKCYCCRIGFNDNGQVYIVPLSFGYVQDKGKYIFYFHGAKEGKKINLIQKNPKVGFELDTNYKLNKAKVACNYSACFQSIIGNGTINLVTEEVEKKIGLCSIMEHNTKKQFWEFSENMLNVVSVFKLTVSNLSCKEHL